MGLLVAAFACGLKRLRRVEDLAQDLGARGRRQRGLAAGLGVRLHGVAAVGGPDAGGAEAGVAAQVRRRLQAPGPPTGALPVGVMSFDGKSLWTSVQREVDALEAVACDEAGTPVSAAAPGGGGVGRLLRGGDGGRGAGAKAGQALPAEPQG